MRALQEWRKREAEHVKRARDLETVTKARDEMKEKHDNLRKKRLEEFMSGFNTISSKLKEMYQVSRLDNSFGRATDVRLSDDYPWWQRRVGTRR